MNNQETADHIRKYVELQHGLFSWVTDACGYDQHIKFANYRNKNWKGSTIEEFKQFVLEYADQLEKEQ